VPAANNKNAVNIIATRRFMTLVLEIPARLLEDSRVPALPQAPNPGAL
jgi:hypothetical protein